MKTITPQLWAREIALRAPGVPAWTARLVLLLLIAFGTSHAQKNILFDHLTSVDGLSQVSVTCILQDRQGFMWFGSQDGLNRYDGYTMKIFKSDPEDSTSLGENFIVSLTEDRSGVLWIGTVSHPEILSRYDPLTESFAEYARDSVDLSGAHENNVNTTYEEPSGVRWSGSIGGGVTRFDPTIGAKTVFKHDPDDPGSLTSDNVYCVYGDRSGTIWVGTREGLEQYNRETESFIHYRHDPSDPASLSADWVWPIFEDRSGTLWVGTFGGGLNRFDRNSRTFNHYRNSESDPRSLAQDQVYSIYQDRSGLIWVGTADHGVDRFHPELAAFDHYTRDPSDPQSLIDNMIKAIHVDRAGVPWIGTTSGLARLDRATGRFRTYQHDPANPRSLVDNRIQSIYEDRSGILWVGTFSSGLERFDRRTGVFTHYRRNPDRPGTLSDDRIYALVDDPDGNLWVGTYGRGLNKLDRKTGTFTVYGVRDSLSGGLSAPGVWALCVDREGMLWIGTAGGGIDRLDRKTETFAHYPHVEGDPTSLSDPLVLSIYEDRQGTIWVGTASGLNRLDRETGKFRQYLQRDGMPNDLVLGILEDGRGNLWISTAKGLSRFNVREGSFSNYGYSDGLQGDDFNQNAYARSPVTGELYFGGANGFNVFHPDSIKGNPYVPPVVFSSFRRYNTDDEEGTPIEEKGIAVRPSITLSYKDNVAIFQFAALSFYNPRKNRYQYRLDGYGENWIQLGTDNVATFTNLDGGDYTLRVRGSNNDGLWNNDGATLALTVTPPWWKSTWAYGTYGVMIIAFLYGARRFEINQREQKARIRESELHAKAAEAEKRALQAENERQMKELEDARRLQLSMLPQKIPAVPDYEIGVFMKTATEVGGDYYDFSPGQDSTMNVAFGDATGHGMQAGTIVTLMKGLFISDASRFDITTFFNHCSNAIKGIRLGRLFMAFTLVRVRGNFLSLSSAGMPPAYLHRKGDGSIEEILLKGMPLGAMKNFPYLLHETEMHPGDTLLLLTDGLPEQKNAQEEMFDYARVEKVFREHIEEAPDEIIARLVHEGESWMGETLQEDDITLMVIRRKEESVSA